MRTVRHLGLGSLALVLFGTGLLTVDLNAADRRVSDIRSTKHNLSAQSGNSTRAASEAEVCIFCHTPHGASTEPGAPLWNRQLTTASHTLYSSASLDAATSMAAPSGQSKLCLSCHDGTLAINAVGNMSGSGTGSNYIEMIGQGNNTTSFAMPSGSGADTGFTRNLGVNLSNDHPISFPYSTELADADGELRDPATETHIGTATVGNRPLYPLTDGNLQCSTCHDPHIKGMDNPNNVADVGNNAKFLRGPRFQISNPLTSGVDFVQGEFNPSSGNATSGDIVCLACHDRELGVEAWAKSAHANPDVADETYTVDAANQREFPSGIKVWQASCLNCHDTHTVAGSRRLLREGTDSTASPKSAGKAAIEETCYQCHTGGADGPSILNAATGIVPNIESEFKKLRRMPIATDDQRTSTITGGLQVEEHDITDANLLESADALGASDNRKRHAECTDCHNPHRLTRNARFNDNADGATMGNDSLRTHIPGRNATSLNNNETTGDGREGNVISGVLRGGWGIDLKTPSSFRTSLNANYFPELMTPAADFFEVRQGDPGTDNLSTAEGDKHLTREYQLCFKCHSSWSQRYRTTTGGTGGTTDRRSETDIPLGGANSHNGATNSGTNGMTYYTNVAAEFLSVNATNPPTSGTDQGEATNSGSACGGGNCTPAAGLRASGGTGTDAENHRSWHPVVFPTGRDRTERHMGSGSINLLPPWNDKVGTQTMHCSDCHGGEASYTFTSAQGVTASADSVQGPHGSDSIFLLKSNATNLWAGGQPNKDTAGTGTGLTTPPNNYGFCGNCHQPRVNDGSGFTLNGGTTSHLPNSNMGKEACMNCHIAVPHGWKNKAFLVNLLCVGPEGGQTGNNGCTEVGTDYSEETIQPYYNRAYLRVSDWVRSGNWDEPNCENGNNNMQGSCPSSG